MGLAFIHQAQNLVLGTPKVRRLGFVDWAAARRSVEDVGPADGHQLLPGPARGEPHQWLLSMARALTLKSRLIPIDEPTAFLSTEEVEHLFSAIRELSSQGIAVIYVMHRLHEIEAICQRVTIFKDGSAWRSWSGGRSIGRRWQRRWDHSVFCIGQVGASCKQEEFHIGMLY